MFCSLFGLVGLIWLLPLVLVIWLAAIVIVLVFMLRCFACFVGLCKRVY